MISNEFLDVLDLVIRLEGGGNFADIEAQVRRHEIEGTRRKEPMELRRINEIFLAAVLITKKIGERRMKRDQRRLKIMSPRHERRQLLSDPMILSSIEIR